MFELSKIIGTGLKNDTNVSAAFGVKIYPMYAPDKTKGSFITYKVQQLEEASKDGLETFNIIVWNWAIDYDTALQQAEIVNTAMLALNYEARVYSFTEGLKDPGITDDYEIFVEQIYTIQI